MGVLKAMYSRRAHVHHQTEVVSVSNLRLLVDEVIEE